MRFEVLIMKIRPAVFCDVTNRVCAIMRQYSETVFRVQDSTWVSVILKMLATLGKIVDRIFPNYIMSIQKVRMVLLIFPSLTLAVPAFCVHHKNTNWTQGSDYLLQ